MRYFLVLLILTIGTYQGKCQDSLKNVVKVSLLSSIDPFNPSVDLSYERYLKEKQSIQFLFGYLLPNGQNSHGFKVRTEYRFYSSVLQGFYIAPELFYMYNNYKTSNVFGKLYDTTGYNYVDTFKIDKQVLAISGKVGYQFRYKHFCVDFFTGVGIRFRFVKQYNILLKNQTDELVGSGKDFDIRPLNDLTIPVSINLSLNIKVGFVF